jgi:EAL domain-containing protein (putative c-di-GMP-specific phosphodiesterase class I)
MSIDDLFLAELPQTLQGIHKLNILCARQHRSPVDKASAIISLANSPGLQTIAEGKETKGQLEILCEQDCKGGAGILFQQSAIRRKVRGVGAPE